MASGQTSPPRDARALRLVHAPEVRDTEVLPRRNARHNREPARRIASLSASDPRWVLAVRTANALDGGRAAILPPAKRTELESFAGDIGLRQFDASLVIAIVQDAARSGRGPLNEEVERRLGMVRLADPGRDVIPAWQYFVAAVVLAMTIFLCLTRWVSGG